MADKEQYMYHCDGKKRCKKSAFCYQNGGPCELTLDKKHAIAGTTTVTVDIKNEL